MCSHHPDNSEISETEKKELFPTIPIEEDEGVADFHLVLDQNHDSNRFEEEEEAYETESILKFADMEPMWA